MSPSPLESVLKALFFLPGTRHSLPATSRFGPDGFACTEFPGARLPPLATVRAVAGPNRDAWWEFVMKNLIKPCLVILVCALVPVHAIADEVIIDDLIVDGNQCLGLDCVEGEVFGFDTLRLKENNVRIRFQDTSNSAAFPTTDWQITINDTNNGGDAYFAVENLDAAVTPFKVDGLAPADSFIIGTNGLVGIGTGTPQRQLHVSSANAPTLRLEQNGSGGFTPASWDISANEERLAIIIDGTTVLELEANGDMTIPGSLTAGTPPSSFPDYVFQPNYALMPLEELRNYIDANSHLPGIPSATDVAENGVNMTELQVSLLKKVEELTLYTLQQQEQITALQRQIHELSAQN